MKIIGIMPIKMNNQRLPGKNTMLLNGKPLLQYQLEAGKKSGLLDMFYVFCSDEKIKDFMLPGVSFLKRSSDLDLPTANFTQIFDSFMKVVDADIYVYIHATAPFIKSETISECIEAVKSGMYDSAFCATKIQDFLWQDGKPLNFNAANIPQSQDLVPIYRETSGCYVFTKDVFINLRRRIGNTPFIHEATFKEAIDINNPEDFELAKIMINF
ncbi:MAG: hypothetical protein K2N58_04425 [Treponemataceae bacterium]|nr:hypothetical protein [Treponemataceae bacterium]